MAKIREHEWNDIGRCQHCGAVLFATLQQWCRDNHKSVPGIDERQCLLREKPGTPRQGLYPLAHEDADTICARLAELKAESEAAQIAKHCAAMAGQPKSDCHQCTVNCLVCSRARGKGIPECAICWHTPAKPCP